MKKILTLVADYPSMDGKVALMYVHVRNKYYIRHEIDVTVLNFAAKKDYEIDGIKVITLNTYKRNHLQYDTLVLHAANLRNHFLFLKRYEKRFKHMVFFFHGHEVVMIHEVYPAPYPYTKKSGKLRVYMQNLYDKFKLSVWRYYLPRIAGKSDFIFVSKCFFGEFKKYIRLDEKDLNNHIHIINNSVGEVFEKNSYCFKGEKKYDFITIRNNMDGSKYCIDLVDQLARMYPQYKFLIIGRGDYYKVHNVPGNVTWVDKFLNHEQIMSYINQSKCGLLLTREDTQGVMTCELAVYGIPVITSDIAVCREICGNLENVELIDNDVEKVDLENVFVRITGKKYRVNGSLSKSERFSYRNTVKSEEEIIKGGGYDFITIRNNLDSSTYCIDLICSLASANPQFKFLVIGRGKWFQYHAMPENLTWINQYLDHAEMLKYVDMARCALMPTRRDTQGVMACELATYGIPLITSDLPVCHEMFDDNPLVTLIDNKVLEKAHLEKIIRKPQPMNDKKYRFIQQRTIGREVILMKEGGQ